MTVAQAISAEKLLAKRVIAKKQAPAGADPGGKFRLPGHLCCVRGDRQKPRGQVGWIETQSQVRVLHRRPWLIFSYYLMSFIFSSLGSRDGGTFLGGLGPVLIAGDWPGVVGQAVAEAGFSGRRVETVASYDVLRCRE